MTVERLRQIVNVAVPTLFAQIYGGRVQCESEATLQLHLGRVITTVADLAITTPRETFSIELEKPLADRGGKRGRIDIWFRLTDDEDRQWRCAIELKFFKRANQREPNNRYDVFKDISRLERCGDVADLGFMLVGTDHPHYITKDTYSGDTAEFDLRHGKSYSAGTKMTYRTVKPHGDPITLEGSYDFIWAESTNALRYLLLEVRPG
jgi:hypothetical protein